MVSGLLLEWICGLLGDFQEADLGMRFPSEVFCDRELSSAIPEEALGTKKEKRRKTGKDVSLRL